MKPLNPKSVVAVILASTVCIVIVATVIGAIFYPPGTVTETFRVKMFELLIYILGIVSGWLLGKGTEENPPEQKP